MLVANLGCESSYGINRGAELKGLPGGECVSRVLHAVPEISSVQDDHAGLFHRYRYAGEGFWAYVSFAQEADGSIWFLNSRISVNSKPATDELAVTRRMMRAVEGRIAAECGVPELLDRLVEECLGVDCSDDPT